MERKELTGVDAEQLTEFVVQSRAEATMKQYSVALKRVWFYGQKTERTVFRWGEGEVCAFLMDLSALGGSENLMKQSLAVIAMVFEAMGRPSPTKSLLVGQVKKASVKRRVVKKIKPRAVMKLQDLVIMVENLYKGPSTRVKAVDRRCLVMQLFLFLGMKRFSDIRLVKVKDVVFKRNGSVEVSVGKTKTDQAGRGSKFVMVGSKKRRVFAADILRWYIESLSLGSEDFVFPSLRGDSYGGVKARGEAVAYGEALADLRKVCKRLGLPQLTLHSARIGAATEGAKAGVSREFLKACGGWSSGAVDGYVRLQEPGLVFNEAIFRKV